MSAFALLFSVLCISVAALLYYNRSRKPAPTGDAGAEAAAVALSPAFRRFQLRYLFVYILAVTADWLQGPYVYALYEWYGFSRAAIARFFIVGFGSSLVFGTFVGALADKHGRKRFSVLYGLLYACSCLCKMVNSWPVLVLGRLLSGVSTSLLFSVFDSWMVSEHRRNGFPDAGLANTFSIATLSNGVSAVLSGIVASAVADDWALGYGFRAPFAVAATVLVGLAFLVHFSWTENVGEASQSQQQQQQSPSAGIIGRVFGNALADLRTNRRVALLCGIQSLFEGAMYSFVFAWTPALRGPCGGDEANDALPPLGWVFAAYMVGIMIGSQLFTLAVTKFRMTVERVAQYTFAAASGALIVGCTAVQMRPGTCADAGTHTSVVLVAFVVFEICCGVYFPCMGTLKGLHLPERSRSALMNFARVGLNLFLLVILLSADLLSNAAIIGICATALAGACFCQTAFNGLPPVASAAASATEEMV